jgi:hypothetical protein
MIRKILFGFIIVSLHSSPEAFCFNEKLLDDEAKGFALKIWSGPTLSKSEIKDSLQFLDKEDENVIKKYSQQTKIQQLFDKVESSSSLKKVPSLEEKNARFLDFARMCMDIFKEGNEQTKASTYLLLKNVNEEFGNYIKQVERSIKCRSQSENSGTASINMTDMWLQAIRNSDKSLVFPDVLQRSLEENPDYVSFKNVIKGEKSIY